MRHSQRTTTPTGCRGTAPVLGIIKKEWPPTHTHNSRCGKQGAGLALCPLVIHENVSATSPASVWRPARAAGPGLGKGRGCRVEGTTNCQRHTLPQTCAPTAQYQRWYIYMLTDSSSNILCLQYRKTYVQTQEVSLHPPYEWAPPPDCHIETTPYSNFKMYSLFWGKIVNRRYCMGLYWHLSFHSPALSLFFPVKAEG